MEYILKIAIMMLLALTLYSCSDIEYNQNQYEEEVNMTFDIDKIRMANNQELILISNFISQINSRNNSNYKLDINFDDPEIVTYTNLPGKAIVLNYKNENQREISAKSLILVVSDENRIITNFEYVKIDNNKNFYTIITSKDGEKWFTAEVDKNTEEIIKFNFITSVNNRTAKKDMTFWECAEMAVSACVDDGECAFICGIIWQYCLGSIGLACAYVAIT